MRIAREKGVPAAGVCFCQKNDFLQILLKASQLAVLLVEFA
jgi:hypothetical protein